MLETEIKANIVAWVDKQSIDQAWKEFARDTKKVLDPVLKRDLEINLVNLQNQLDKSRSILKEAKKQWDGELIFNTKLDINKLSRDTTEAKRQLNNFINTWDQWLSRLQAKFDWIWKWLQSMFTRFVWVWTIIAWIWTLGKAVVKLWWDLEQARISFTTMLWSGEKADTLLKDLAKFAAKTPFELVWIRQNAKQLLAMWISAEDLIPTMKSLWDVAAWLSVPLDRLALAYWQVISKGRLQGWELKQFTEAWVPLLAQLANMLWKTSWEILKLIENWQISSWLVVEAFRQMSSWTWKFADLMWKQSETLQWKWSNLKDNVNLLWERIWTALIPALSKWIDVLNWLLNTSEVTNWTIESLRWEMDSLSAEFESWQIDVISYSQKMAELSIKLEEAVVLEEALRKKIIEVRSEMAEQEKKLKSLSKKQAENTKQTLEWTRWLAWQWSAMDTVSLEMWIAKNTLESLNVEYQNLIWNTDKSTNKTEEATKATYDYWNSVWSGTKKVKEQSKETKEYESTLKSFTSQVEKAYDTLNDKIDSSIDKQKKLKDELKWLDNDIIWRVVEIDNQIQEIEKERSKGVYTDEQQKEIEKLQAERLMAFKWLDEGQTTSLKKQIDERVNYENLSEIEKLQTKRITKEQELSQEIEIEKQLKDELKAIEDQYSEYLIEKKKEELAMAEQLRLKRLEVAAARTSAWLWWTTIWARANWWPVSAWSPYIVWERWPEMFVPQSNGNIVPNHNLTVNTNVNANVANWMDIDMLANQLARKIVLAGKGIQ